MTDIVPVPPENFIHCQTDTLEIPVGLINADWNQAVAMFSSIDGKTQGGCSDD